VDFVTVRRLRLTGQFIASILGFAAGAGGYLMIGKDVSDEVRLNFDSMILY
jgi:hypothetical protein